MYIKSVHIQNIRSISELTLDFGDDETKMAGWHVLIGENGSGKTTILRCMAMGLMGLDDRSALRIKGNDYNSTSGAFARIRQLLKLDLATDNLYKGSDSLSKNLLDKVDLNSILISEIYKGELASSFGTLASEKSNYYQTWVYDSTATAGEVFNGSFEGFFSSAFGPFRRFNGGNDSWEDVYDSSPRAAAHMSLFGEDVALTQIEPWLNYLHQEELEEKRESIVLRNIKTLLNDRGLLPDGVQLVKINRDGLFFKDGNGASLSLHQLSDGYRSVLSLTMELIRQLIRVYGEEKVFEGIEKGGSTINLPGVVLIDEIDAHLHPTWQTQIGQWFTKYFPKLQFIVTTHSPLICRACGENGRIWHLRAPGSAEDTKEITGQDRNRLVYGNILDAYSTDAFGEGVMRSEEGSEKYRRLGELNMKSIMGVLSDAEKAEFETLQTIFPSGK